MCDGSLVYGSSIEVVMGDLSVSGSDLVSLSLPSLWNVTGDVRISDNYDVTEVSLPALEAIGGDLYMQENYGDFSSFDMSALRYVGGDVGFTSNDNMRWQGLPALEEVGGSFQIYHSPYDGRDYDDDESPGDFGSLRSIGGQLEVEYNHMSSTLDMAQLETVGEQLEIVQNDGLTDVQLPLLNRTGAYLKIYDNEALSSLDISSLSSVNSEGWESWCGGSGDNEDVCIYNNDLGDSETEVSLAYSALSVYTDSCLVFTDRSYYCFADGTASDATSCAGDLSPYSADDDTYKEGMDADLFFTYVLGLWAACGAYAEFVETPLLELAYTVPSRIREAMEPKPVNLAKMK